MRMISFFRASRDACRLLGAGLLGVVFFSISAAAEPRIALVVGNQSYDSVVALDNPVADSALIAAKLAEKGFEVTQLADAGQSELNRAIAQFGRDLRAAGDEATGLFYYAGHGVQSFGANYLLPVDVALTDAADLSLVAVRADAVLRQMASAQNRTNIVILDACRNNPFEDIPDMDDNGLAEMKAPAGTFMAYSTAPGSVAVDGASANSPFTEALASAIDNPGATIEQALKEVRSKVIAATNGQQTPWDTSSLMGDFAFTPVVQKSPEEIAADRFFESIQQSRDPVQIVLFLRTYPDSVHFDQARALLSEVLDGSAPAAPPDQAQETVAAPAAAAPTAPPDPEPVASRPATATPAENENDLIEAAQESGLVADYEAYLAAFPDGVFAELARMEIEAQVAMDPAAPAGGLEETVAVAPEPTPEPVQPAVGAEIPVFFDTPLVQGGPDVEGRSIEELVGGAPLFPPIEGLPPEVWQDRPCATCHEWTRAALCDQARTYLAEAGTRSLAKEHPYGGGLKRGLRTWAQGDCR